MKVWIPSKPLQFRSSNRLCFSKKGISPNFSSSPFIGASLIQFVLNKKLTTKTETVSSNDKKESFQDRIIEYFEREGTNFGFLVEQNSNKKFLTERIEKDSWIIESKDIIFRFPFLAEKTSKTRFSNLWKFLEEYEVFKTRVSFPHNMNEIIWQKLITKQADEQALSVPFFIQPEDIVPIFFSPDLIIDSSGLSHDLNTFKLYMVSKFLAENPLYFPRSKNEKTFMIRSQKEFNEIKEKCNVLRQSLSNSKILGLIRTLPKKELTFDIKEDLENWEKFKSVLRYFAFSRHNLWIDPEFLSLFQPIFGHNNFYKSDLIQLIQYWKIFDPYENHVLNTFSLEHLPEYSLFHETKEDIGREIFSLPVFTIDSEYTEDIDDGVSIELGPNQSLENAWIHIHISDPTTFFGPHSDLDKLVRTRGTSVYLPDEVIHMFPRNLTLEMGLSPSEPQNIKNYAITFSAKLDEKGALTQSQIQRTILTDVHKYCYSKVETILKASNSILDAPDEHLRLLQQLLSVAMLRKKYRKDKGAFFFHSPSPDVKIDKSQFPPKVSLISDTNYLSRLLVQECMILAGEIAALYADEHKIPISFRHQNFPMIPEHISKNPKKSSLLNHLGILKWFQEAKLSSQAKPHYGVGLKHYSRVTSPIRRYSDILTHHQIIANLKKQTLPFTDTELDSMFWNIQKTEENAKLIQNISRNFWIDHYLPQFPDNIYYGYIISETTIKKNGIGVTTFEVIIMDLGIRVTLPKTTHLEEGQIVRLKYLKKSPKFRKEFKIIDIVYDENEITKLVTTYFEDVDL